VNDLAMIDKTSTEFDATSLVPGQIGDIFADGCGSILRHKMHCPASSPLMTRTETSLRTAAE
jgi:hypothetical protein